jgi:hypothetical protein
MKKLEVTGRIVPLLKAAKPFDIEAIACSLIPQWM